MKIDKTDRRVIRILEGNGRTSNKDIAEQLGVSEGTIRNRIGKLKESHYLKVKGLINPDMNPDYQLVFLGAKVAVSKDLKMTATLIKKLPYVKAVNIVSGRYDLLIEIFLPNHGLISFLSDHLAKVDSVISTESFIALSSTDKWV